MHTIAFGLLYSTGEHVAQALKLIPSSKATILTAKGPSPSNMYAVDFTFPGSGIDIQNCRVMEVDLSRQICEVLIGRDVLLVSKFQYDGGTGIFTIEIPSPALEQKPATHKRAASTSHPVATRKSKKQPRAVRKKKKKARKK